MIKTYISLLERNHTLGPCPVNVSNKNHNNVTHAADLSYPLT